MTKNPMEEMLMQCPMDTCDGTGIVEGDDGTDGAHDRICPHTKPDDDYDADSRF